MMTDESKKDIVVEYVLLGFIVASIGWLMYKYTGDGANQISPQFWGGSILTIFIQLTRKTFDLKKPDKS